MRSPEQQFNFAKRLPVPELVKVLQGQSDAVDMSIAEMVLRQKMQMQKAQQGVAAMPMAQSPKVVEKDLMDAGVAGMPTPNLQNVDSYAGGGIVAFQAGGQSSLPFASSVGSPLQSTRVPGPGPTFSSVFGDPTVRAAASRMPGIFGRISAALNPMLMLESMTGPSESDVTKLREFDKAKAVLKEAGFTDKDINALATPDVYRMAAGYGYKPSVAAAPSTTAAPTTPATPAAPGAAPPVPSPELPREKGIAALVAPKLNIPKELTPAEAGQERLDYYKERGISEDPYKAYREALEKDRATDKEARTEAGWGRLLEAGLGIMGGESPYAFTNIGKGAQAAAKGAVEDMKEFRKLERDRKKEEARLVIEQNNYLKSGADSDLAKVEKRRDTISAIGIKQAELEKDITVANATLESHRLTRADTREATLKTAALKQAESEMAKRLALNPGLATNPVEYDRQLNEIYYAHLTRLMGEKAPVAPASTSGARGKVVNGVYVPAGQ